MDDGGPGHRAPHRYNFVLGAARVAKCRAKDDDVEIVEKVTYKVSVSETGSAFLGRWRHEDLPSPDMAALVDYGQFESLYCNSPSAVCTSSVPDIDVCYAIVYDDGSIEEWGGGPEGCGSGLNWGMDGSAPALAPGESAAVWKFAKDADSNSYYDFEDDTGKDLMTNVSHNCRATRSCESQPQLVFTRQVDTSNLTILALSDQISVFGYLRGSTFYVEGWRWPKGEGP